SRQLRTAVGEVLRTRSRPSQARAPAAGSRARIGSGDQRPRAVTSVGPRPGLAAPSPRRAPGAARAVAGRGVRGGGRRTPLPAHEPVHADKAEGGAALRRPGAPLDRVEKPTECPVMPSPARALALLFLAAALLGGAALLARLCLGLDLGQGDLAR